MVIVIVLVLVLVPVLLPLLVRMLLLLLLLWLSLSLLLLILKTRMAKAAVVPVSVNKTFLLWEPSPYNPAAKTALQPRIWCSESWYPNMYLFLEESFCSQTPAREGVMKIQPCFWRACASKRPSHTSGAKSPHLQLLRVSQLFCSNPHILRHHVLELPNGAGEIKLVIELT